MWHGGTIGLESRPYPEQRESDPVSLKNLQLYPPLLRTVHVSLVFLVFNLLLYNSFLYVCLFSLCLFMFSIKIKIDCFTATLCSIIIVTDKLIIIIYFLIFEDKNNLCEVFTPTSPSSV